MITKKIEKNPRTRISGKKKLLGAGMWPGFVCLISRAVLELVLEQDMQCQKILALEIN